jgi:serine protease AprX
MTLTASRDPFTTETPGAARHSGRVWEKLPASRVDERPGRGATTVALIAAGALTLGGVAFSTLDDGPAAPAPAVVSMYDVAASVGAPTLWAEGITGRTVNVALIDTGVEPVDALSDRIVAAVDLSDERDDPSAAFGDSFGHGTHMAGIIAGRQPGADPALAADHPEWFLGIAPEAGIVSVKIAGRDGTVTGANLIAGIDWAIEHADELDISVLTLAFDAGAIDSYRTDPVAAALERAWAAGIVVVTAAGNGGAESGGLASAAQDPFVIAVAGVDTSGDEIVPADWTSAGNEVRTPDVAAPGAHVASLRVPGSDADVSHPEGYVDDQRFLASGSSPAAAVVAGAAALLIDADPDLTPDQVKQMLIDSSSPIDAVRDRVGAGLVDTVAAVSTTPTTATQNWAPATDAGGAVRDATISFEPSSSSWSSSSWSSSSWSSSSWSSSSWSSSSWSSSSWSSSSWSSSSWSSSSWSSSSWSSSSWS